MGKQILKKKSKYIIMNPSIGFIQLLFYYPVLSLYIYIYLVAFIPKMNAISINYIYSQFISKLAINKEENF